MFGNKSGHIAKMVEKREWDKISLKLNGYDETSKLELAVACGNSSDEKAPDILVDLLKDTSVNVQLQAVKSLGLTGTQNAKTHLLWLLDHLPENGEALRKAIQETLVQIGVRR